MSREAQLDLLDALARVEQGSDPDWLDEAHRVLDNVISAGKPFISEHVMARILTPCREPRAMGALIRQASREGRIKPTGRYVTGERRTSHCRPQREWVRA